MRALLMVLIAGVGGADSALAQTDPAAAGREARIAAHRKKIEDIIRANTTWCDVADIRSTASLFPINTMPPDAFNQQVVPLLEEIQASAVQVQRLREINEKLWEMRSAGQSGGKNLEASLKLRAEQQKVLTPEQQKAFTQAYASRRMQGGVTVRQEPKK